MNYELAKELRDAGFPQPDTLSMKGEYPLIPEGTEPFLPAYAPTLSELIEACGEDFGALLRVPTGNWQAMGGKLIQSLKYALQGEYSIRTLRSTPEEAVARLWLALNKKA